MPGTGRAFRRKLLKVHDFTPVTGVNQTGYPRPADGYFLRSDRAHAEIISIEKEEALRAKGVVAIFTGPTWPS